MRLRKQPVKALREARNAELVYCEQMVARGHKSPHWAIRVSEIKAALKTRKKK